MGMLSFNLTCPHCLRENAVLEAFSEKERHDSAIYDVAFACRSCEKGGIAVVAGSRGPYHLAKSGPNIVIPSDGFSFQIMDVYPAIETLSAPDNSPPKAARFFVEAKENLNRGNFETSVMLCRKVLDIATKEILGVESGNEKLSKRISMLHAKGKITEQMNDWAHIVRKDSNEAVHSDEEFTKEEAEELIGFTEVFLIYSFTLPAMVTAKQQAFAANKN